MALMEYGWSKSDCGDNWTSDGYIITMYDPETGDHHNMSPAMVLHLLRGYDGAKEEARTLRNLVKELQDEQE